MRMFWLGLDMKRMGPEDGRQVHQGQIQKHGTKPVKKKPICKAQVQTELRLQRVLRTTEKGSLKLCSKTRRTSKGSAHCLGQME